MGTILPLLALLAAISTAYVILRRMRLVRENRERQASIVVVDEMFVRVSDAFSVPKAAELVQKIKAGRLIRKRYLQPELSRLESAVSAASRWSHNADPEHERKIVLDGVAHLYVKWRHNKASL